MSAPPNDPPAGLFSAGERDEYRKAGPKRRTTMIREADARISESAIEAKRYSSHRVKLLDDDGDEDPDLDGEVLDEQTPEPVGERPVHQVTEWRRQKRWLDTYRGFIRQGMGDEKAVARTNAIVTPDGLWRKRCICGREFLAKRRTAKYAPDHDRCRKRVDEGRFDPASRLRWNRP